MNLALVGETAAKIMDRLADGDGELVDVLIVAVVDEPDGDGTYTRVESSALRLHEQLGLLYQGIRVVELGNVSDDAPDDEEP